MRDKDPWWHQYCLALILLLGFLLLTFVFKFLYKSSQSLLITSLLLSYGAYGSLRFIFTNEIMRRVWVKTKLSYEESEKISKEAGPTRIRANNFVIGNGISLITGVIGGIVFWLFYNSTVIIRSIENAYGVVK